jgi:hypothetical protein
VQWLTAKTQTGTKKSGQFENLPLQNILFDLSFYLSVNKGDRPLGDILSL